MSTPNTEIQNTRSNEAVAQTRAIEFIAPVVDLHREENAYRLDIEMPGVPKSGVDLSVENGKLHITGHRAASATATKKLHQERELRDYRRVFDLDPTIDPGTIEASMDQGLLQIRLRKAEAHQPRKIAVA